MGSPFFARIKRDVLAIAATIPPGRVCAFADIGAHLDVMPRHVAYILATLSEIEKATTPWHRVVASGGALGTAKADADGTSQRRLLEAEGLRFDGDGRIANFDACIVLAADLAHGVPKQTRPANAPAARAPRRR
jgi:methylated-DNA-protein-cysteine methyltransferase-like protein